MAFGELGKGRVLAIAHTGYLDSATMKVEQTGKFMLAGTLRACAAKKALTRVLVVGSDFAAFLNGQDAGGWFKAEAADRGKREWSDNLAGRFDVVCISGNDLTDAQVAALKAFAQNGGGIVAAQTAWAWDIPAGKSHLDNPLNRLFADAGIAWTRGYTDKPEGGVLKLDARPDPLLNASVAIEELALFKPGSKPDDRVKLAAAVVTAAARHLPRTDAHLRPRLLELAAGRAAFPTAKAALTEKQPLERVLLALQVADLEADSGRDADAVNVKAHPAAADFPGTVPADAPRVTRSISIDLTVPGWHSTGLYAPPGEVVGVKVRLSGDGATAADAKGLAVRIGAHKDELWHHTKWERVPEVTRQWPVGVGDTRVASAFGGLVYVVVPDAGGRRTRANQKAAARSGVATVEVSGCVEAPRFVLGETDLDHWRTTARNHPAPWAELESSKVIVTVPADAVRTLEDPAETMRTWDTVADAAADLATIPRDRARPERYVADRQISAGYMHAGYPIMTHLDAAADMVSAANLRTGTWGLFHELGHNHQVSDWTFNGTGEVTVNLFSLYIMETVCGKPMNQGHPALAERERLVAKHKAKGVSFDHWKNDPFLALVMYQQLREAFGWETYKRVFAEYRDLPAQARPKGEGQERDQWMVRFSRAAGRNLGPFFQAWGVPTSAEARASVKDLPGWMPPDWPGPPEPQGPVGPAGG
jgi:hypothetical protein